MKKMLKAFGILMIFALATGIAFAEGEEGEEEPLWFKLLEIGGLVIGIAAALLTLKNYLGMKGGIVGESFKFVLAAIILITLAITIDGLTEWFGILSEFAAELIYEIAVYASLVLIAVASKKAMA